VWRCVVLRAGLPGHWLSSLLRERLKSLDGPIEVCVSQLVDLSVE
jgi:hypothetical protein